jgi:transposase
MVRERASACGLSTLRRHRRSNAVGGRQVADHVELYLVSRELGEGETASRFAPSWHVVFDAVRHAVEWGRAHRNLDSIRSIGVDELSSKQGHKFLTLVYQIDHGCKRLLWIGRDRTSTTTTPGCDSPKRACWSELASLSALQP